MFKAKAKASKKTPVPEMAQEVFPVQPVKKEEQQKSENKPEVLPASIWKWWLDPLYS